MNKDKTGENVQFANCFILAKNLLQAKKKYWLQFIKHINNSVDFNTTFVIWRLKRKKYLPKTIKFHIPKCKFRSLNNSEYSNHKVIIVNSDIFHIEQDIYLKTS